MAHIIRENAGKKFRMISELFTNKNFEYTFVLFVSDQSLLVQSMKKCIMLKIQLASS